jgi:hypothetical protein
VKAIDLYRDLSRRISIDFLEGMVDPLDLQIYDREPLDGRLSFAS